MSDHFGSINIDSKPSKKKAKVVRSALPRRPDSSSARPPQSKKIFWISGGITLLAVCYFFAGVYLAPVLIEKYLSASLEKIGLTLQVESIELNPLNYQLTLQNTVIALPGESAAEPLLQIDSIFMDLDLTSLLRNGLVCDALQIQDLRLELVRQKDATYNLPDALHLNKQENAGEIIDFAQLPFLFSLNNITVSNSRILFQDLLTGKTHVVEKLNLSIPSFSNFSFQSRNYITPHFSAIINGSPIQLSGESIQTADGQGFQTSLSCNVQSLELAPYFSYLPSTLPLTVTKGKADAQLQIVFAPEQKQGSRLSIDFTLNATDVEVIGKNRTYTVSLPKVHTEGSLSPFAKRFYIKNIVAKNPTITDQDTLFGHDLLNLLAYFSPENKTSHLAIDMLLIDQGRFVSHSSGENNDWNSLLVSVKNFRSPHWNPGTQSPSPFTLRISGEHKNGQGSFSWQAQLAEFGNLHGPLEFTAIPADEVFAVAEIGNIEDIEGSAAFTGELALFPWEKKNTGYTISNGSLQIDNLLIQENDISWLKSQHTRIGPIQKNADQCHLGSIFLKDADALWYKDKSFPSLLSQPHIQFSGLDYRGTLQIFAENNSEPLLLSDVQLQVKDLDLSPDKQQKNTGNFAFSTNMSKKGTLKAKGRVTLSPFSMQVEVGFTDIESPLFSPFFPDQLLLQNSRAVLHGKGMFNSELPSFKGSLRITDAVLQRSPDSVLLRLQSAEGSELNCSLSPLQIQAKTVLINAPAFQWPLTAKSSDPFLQVSRGLKILLQDSKQNDSIFPLSIQEIRVQNGTATLQDTRLSPPWIATVEHISGEIKEFSTSSPALSAFSFSGSIAGSPFKLSGAGNLISKPHDGRIILQISDFPLLSLQEQLSSLAINPEKASLDLLLKTSKKNNTTNGQADIQIKDLTPRSMDSGTALTLALLRDPKKTFPVSLQLDDNSSSLFQEALNHFRTTVIKASYAPLLLDHAFVDLQETPQILFESGNDTISQQGHAVVSRYAELLRKHPDLALVVSGAVDRKNDQWALQLKKEAEEQKRVDAINAQGEKEFLSIQKMQLTPPQPSPLPNTTPSTEEIVTYKAIQPGPVQVSDSELLELADSRALVIYDFFLHTAEIDASRIRLGDQTGNISETDGNHVDIQLTPVNSK